jgi:hypothetical protein
MAKKSLLKMSDKEFNSTFDKAMASVDQELLEDARKNAKGTMSVDVAVLFLTLPDGRKRVVHYQAEFGDSHGIGDMEECGRDMVKARLLQPGESIGVNVFHFDLV